MNFRIDVLERRRIRWGLWAHVARLIEFYPTKRVSYLAMEVRENSTIGSGYIRTYDTAAEAFDLADTLRPTVPYYIQVRSRLRGDEFTTENSNGQDD